jgi:hypothetical protein
MTTAPSVFVVEAGAALPTLLRPFLASHALTQNIGDWNQRYQRLLRRRGSRFAAI